jgi:hypothetical protein
MSPPAQLWPLETTVPNTYGTMRRCVKAEPFGVTVHPPVLRHTGNTVGAALIAAGDTRIDVHGGTAEITVTTNLQGWGVKVYEGLTMSGTPLVIQPANPSPAIAPETAAIESSVEVAIPEHATNEAERTLTFVLYCTEYPGAGNEVAVGTWTQRRYYTLDVADSSYGSVAVSDPPASEWGYEYGTAVTLTPTTTDASRFFNGWTVTGWEIAGNPRLTAWSKTQKPLTVTIAGDVEVAAQFPRFTEYGVPIGDNIWASYNVGMPHTFAFSHKPESVRLYKYYNETYYQTRPIVAWPATGTISASNPGYKMTDGTAQESWIGSASADYYDDTPWPSDYARNPCPDGWIIPTTTHWDNLKAAADHARVPATGTPITGYSYTSKINTAASIYLPLSPRREYNTNGSTSSNYAASDKRYMTNYTTAQSGAGNNTTHDWDISQNHVTHGTAASEYSWTGTARVIRCVREGHAEYGPVLLSRGNTLPALPDGAIPVTGGSFDFSVSTNLDDWGVRVYEGTSATGTPLIDVRANPSPAIIPDVMPVVSSVEGITIPENETNLAERSFTFVLYSASNPESNVVLGTWTQHKYYTLTVTPSSYGSVAVSPSPPAGKPGYVYGTPLIFTAEATNKLEYFMKEWSAAPVALTGPEKTSYPLNIPIRGDMTVSPHFSPIGVQIGNYIWASLNVGMPHAFTERPEDNGMLYQYYVPDYDMIAWPSTSGSVDTNPGYNYNTGAAVTSWRELTDATNNADLWPADSDVNPCPEGWVVPAQAHLNDLATAQRDPDNVNGQSGYRYTSGASSIFVPHTARRRENGDYYNRGNSSNNYGYHKSSSTANNWNISNPLSSPDATRGGATAVRCVRVAAP